MISPTVSIENLTRPGAGSFQVGDRWRVTVHADPNLKVGVDAGSDKLATSHADYGSTNAGGIFTLEGSMGAGEIGNWREIWMAGGVAASPVLTFAVTAAPAAGNQSSGGSGQQQQQQQTGQQQQQQQQEESIPLDSMGADSSIWSIGGFDLSSIPTWGWVAAAGAALYLMTKGSK